MHNTTQGLSGNEIRISAKVKEIAAIAPMMPCVIVIHELPHFGLRYMSPLGLKLLRRRWDDIKDLTSEQYHATFFNAEEAKDYVPKLLTLFQENTDDVVSFFQQVRTSKEREWDWYMSNLRILLREEKGDPLLTITAAMQIDPQHYFTAKAVRLLEENAFIKKNYNFFSTLTPRETEVLRLIALGKSAGEISQSLNISVATAETHRKNIRQKLNISNNYDVSMYARAFDLI